MSSFQPEPIALYMLEIGKMYDIDAGGGKGFSGILTHTVANKLVLVFDQVNADGEHVMHGNVPNRVNLFRLSVQMYTFGELSLSHSQRAKMIDKNGEFLDQIPPPSLRLTSWRDLQKIDKIPLIVFPLDTPSMSRKDPKPYRVYIEMSTGDYIYKESSGSFDDFYPDMYGEFSQKNESVLGGLRKEVGIPVADGEYGPIFIVDTIDDGDDEPLGMMSVKSVGGNDVREARALAKRRYWR